MVREQHDENFCCQVSIAKELRLELKPTKQSLINLLMANDLKLKEAQEIKRKVSYLSNTNTHCKRPSTFIAAIKDSTICKSCSVVNLHNNQRWHYGGKPWA